MKRSHAVPPLEPRVCLGCHGPLSERRPVFLVRHASGRIIGPYHAGCAERFVLAARKHEAMTEEVIGTTYGVWPSRREETLPW